MCSSKNNLCHSLVLVWQLYLILVMIAAPSCRGDPTNMVDNGNFERMPFNLSLLTPFKDIGFFYKYSTYIPGWSVTKSWVQVVSSEAFQPVVANSSFSIHLNSASGPGAIRSIALTPLRKKARYYVSLRFAGNPDGGPLYKVMQMTISEFNMLFYEVKSRVTLAQSNPYPSRTPMMWMTRKWEFIGTGKKTRLDLESLTSGAYGIFVDDIQVVLDDLVDNGSFEDLTVDYGAMTSSILFVSSTAIRSWLVNAGSVKLLRGRYTSTDNSGTVIDLNGDITMGSVIMWLSTTIHSSYSLLFDAAVNPGVAEKDKLGKPKACSTSLEVNIRGQPSQKILLTKQMTVKRDAGLDMSVEVWTTTELSFDATTFINVTIQFASKIGGNKGPLLDNVQVFEHRTKVTALPINNTATSFHPDPWITTSLPLQSLLTLLLIILVSHVTIEVV